MGLRDFMIFISSTTDKLSSPVTAACWSSYNVSRSAVTTVNSVVMENVVPTVNYYVSDEEGRAVIGRFATSFVKNTAVYGAQECLKWATGPVYNIAKQSLRDAKREDYKEVKRKIDRYKDEVQKLQAKVDGLERNYKEVNMKTDHYKDEVQKLQAKVDILERKLSGGGENIQDDVGKNNQADLKSESRVVHAHLEPDDMIRIFMMKEFSGRFMFDNLVVPGVKKSVSGVSTDKVV